MASEQQQQLQRCSPFKDLNGFEYHDNWLRNLLIAGSMNGYRVAFRFLHNPLEPETFPQNYVPLNTFG